MKEGEGDGGQINLMTIRKRERERQATFSHSVREGGKVENLKEKKSNRGISTVQE